MPQHAAPLNLTSTDRRRVDAFDADLSNHRGDAVTVDYVKRNGDTTTLVGTVGEVIGGNDKRTVVILTDNGYRSANLFNILTYTITDVYSDCDTCGDTGVYSYVDTFGVASGSCPAGCDY